MTKGQNWKDAYYVKTSPVSRRNFLKKITTAGAGTLFLPAAFWLTANETCLAAKSSKMLLNNPCLVRPAFSSISINIVCGDRPIECFARYRETKTRTGRWQKTETFSIDTHTPFNIRLNNLKADTEYEYQVQTRVSGDIAFEPLPLSRFATQKNNRSDFSFAMISDSHITRNRPDRMKTLSKISQSILHRKPDFLIMLGDNIQTFTSSSGILTEEDMGPALYHMLRQGLGELTALVPLFTVQGNWEGENGWQPEKYRTWARNSRMSWIPNPLPDTYAEGGSQHGDYYGFTWGNTLNLVLNVTGYTSTEHVHGSKKGKANDWTLGRSQKQWLYRQLSESDAQWKFIYIHHTVGGNAGDDLNSRYGRGGGRAAHVGEQDIIHEWMKKFNVSVFFYGHDHVFTDITVDRIHYTCVGSAGAPWKFAEKETGYDNFCNDSGYTWVDIFKDHCIISYIKPDSLRPEGTVLRRFKIAQDWNSRSMSYNFAES